MEMMTREEKQSIEERVQFLVNNRKAITTRIAQPPCALGTRRRQRSTSTPSEAGSITG